MSDEKTIEEILADNEAGRSSRDLVPVLLEQQKTTNSVLTTLLGGMMDLLKGRKSHKDAMDDEEGETQAEERAEHSAKSKGARCAGCDHVMPMREGCHAGMLKGLTCPKCSGKMEPMKEGYDPDDMGDMEDANKGASYVESEAINEGLSMIGHFLPELSRGVLALPEIVERLEVLSKGILDVQAFQAEQTPFMENLAKGINDLGTGIGELAKGRTESSKIADPSPMDAVARQAAMNRAAADRMVPAHAKPAESAETMSKGAGEGGLTLAHIDAGIRANILKPWDKVNFEQGRPLTNGWTGEGLIKELQTRRIQVS